jgi:hypothetical protein
MASIFAHNGFVPVKAAIVEIAVAPSDLLFASEGRSYARKLVTA